ncbi:pitrilysin, Metallo peptidase, MEROPS family M16A [Psychromonas ingrahamii 37]|uniref:Protease 3 n=1 Tax=Psychromonas ingrahamii (strain DSM 17664 / CCUG 51855 / 37) TaxID=357804 RepID=A1T098_PSYIN|nr:insulinase family protein [Psychromonas ingrahamii]ABM05163.1 pitrilysin, Metallo peptidase, MEROPS family M16A [Psychromonas ingrahamii 37]
MSYSHRLTVFVFCFTLSFSSLVSADSKQAASSLEILETAIIQSPNDSREYQVIRLANQLEVLLVSDPDLENSAASLSLPIGSMNNPDQQLGLAHYLEHMLFLGSERYPTINEYSKFMTQHGGYTNAYTAQESTVYGFEVNDSHFAEALDRLGDVMRAPLLDKRYADKERNTVYAEHKTYFDNDMRKFYALQHYTLNPDHPTARFSTGNLTTLKDKPGSKLQDELVNFFETYYSANLMKVALTSPRSIVDLQQMAELYLSQIPNKKATKPVIVSPMLTAKELAISVAIKPTANIKLLQVNFLIPSVQDEYMYQPGGYISRLLGSDHEGGLSNQLQKAGLVESVMAGFYGSFSENYSQFSMQFVMTNAGLKEQDKILASLFAYIELIKKQGISQLQYREQKSGLDRDFKFLTKNSGFSYVMGLSANMQNYPYKDLLFHPYRLDGFNAKFISQLLTYLTPENSRIFKMIPDLEGGTQIPYYQGKYTRDIISQKNQQTWLRQAQNIKLTLPAGNPWLPENFNLVDRQYSAKAQQLVNKEGHSVWFKQSAYFKEPKASMKLHLNSDISDQNPESRITMSLLLEMFSKQFAALHFVAGEAGLNFALSHSNGLLISTSGYSDKQDKLLLTVLNEIKNAQFSEQTLNLAKQEVQRQLNNKVAMKPLDFAFEGFRQLVRQPAWSDAALLAEIDGINLLDINQFIEKILSQSSLRLLALGNLSREQVVDLDSALASIVTIEQQPFYTIKRLQADLNEGALNYQISSKMDDDALATIYLSDLKGDAALATAELLNQLLKPAFYNQIRTEEQLSYSPFSASFPVDDYAAFGLFTQSPTLSNAKLYQRFAVFLENFNKQLDKTSKKEFAVIKKAQIANYLAQPTSLSDEFSYLSHQWLSLKPEIDTEQAYIDSLSAVSLTDVKAFFQTVLVKGENSQPVVIQVQGTKFLKEAILQLHNEVKITNIDSLPKH